MYMCTGVYLLIAYLPYCCRICSGIGDIFRLSSNFIESLLRTSSRHWIDQMKRHNVDIFAYNMLLMPYQSGVQKSLFVVLGANNIKDYMKRGFTGTRPCVLHILPYATSNISQLHAYNQVSLTIRTWLNALWRNSQRNSVYMSIPFTHRSMPLSRPFGKLSFHDILTVHNQISSCRICLYQFTFQHKVQMPVFAC